MAAAGLPRPRDTELSKEILLERLVAVDRDEASSARALEMETEFRTRITNHISSLPTADASFAKFNTSPFVLLFYTLQHGFTRISQIENAILPAKVFSSMETSAGRMVEQVVLPKYGWEFAPSGMQTTNSAIDGKKVAGDTLCLATLKSGPRCLNDEMSENFADAIIANCVTWARQAGITKLDFTYGVLYGTKKQSNKKDWHILRIIAAKMGGQMTVTPEDKWYCKFVKDGVEVTVTVRIGIELWNYIAGDNRAYMELFTALLRACVAPSEGDAGTYTYTISDLEQIISLAGLPAEFNTRILQRSQLEWLFFVARHFCDVLNAGDIQSVKS
jgi:hypothetical protein